MKQIFVANKNNQPIKETKELNNAIILNTQKPDTSLNPRLESKINVQTEKPTEKPTQNQLLYKSKTNNFENGFQQVLSNLEKEKYELKRELQKTKYLYNQQFENFTKLQNENNSLQTQIQALVATNQQFNEQKEQEKNYVIQNALEKQDQTLRKNYEAKLAKANQREKKLKSNLSNAESWKTYFINELEKTTQILALNETEQANKNAQFVETENKFNEEKSILNQNIKQLEQKTEKLENYAQELVIQLQQQKEENKNVQNKLGNKKDKKKELLRNQKELQSELQNAYELVKVVNQKKQNSKTKVCNYLTKLCIFSYKKLKTK